MIYVKIHENKVAAICDEDLIGKTFSEGKIELKVSESFYKGELKKDEEVEMILKDFNNVNIIGKKSIELALKVGTIKKENVIVVQGVPHAQSIIL